MRECEFFVQLCASPKAALDSAVKAGKKVIGVMPYFCPEELVYAAGMLPFGLWGAEIQASESRRYFPSFFCSILHTTLELGLRGELDALSGIMIPFSCDSLKNMGTNWRYGVKKVPVINVSYAQNRKIPAGTEFNLAQLLKIKAQLEEICGHEITNEAIAAAVKVYNENRAAVLRFSAAAAKHPELITPAERCAVLKAGYFMDRAEHTAHVNWLSDILEAAPESSREGYIALVTTGIIADSPELLKILEDNRIYITADQICHESVPCRCLTAETEDPLLALAKRTGEIEGSCVLFDPGKERGHQLVKLAQDSGADGVLWVMTKFCDPEEFDFVPVKRMLDAAGIPVLCIEVDQQTPELGQAKSAIRAFAEELRGI